MSIVLKNNASDFLAAAIDSSQTSITLQSAASFPALAAGEYFYGTIEDTAGQVEIVKVTARVGSTLTVVRAQEGTSAASFVQGSRFELRVTVSSVEDFVEQNAELADYTPSGANTVVRTLRNKLRDIVSVRDFGAVGDGTTDDTAAIQAAIDTGKAIYVPPGVYAVSEPIVFPRGGASLIGANEFSFSDSIIRPLDSFSGAALFVIDGDTQDVGPWAFRNRIQKLMLWCDRVDIADMPVVLLIDKAYTIYIEDVWFHNIPGTAVQISASNHVTLNKCLMGGRSNSGSPYGVLVQSDSANNTGGGTFILNCDIENFSVGVRQETNAKVTLSDAYMEANGNAWEAAGNEFGNFTSVGNRILGINASTNIASITGPNVQVFGGQYSRNGGGGIRTDASTSRKNNIQIYGVPNDIFGAGFRNLYQRNNDSDETTGWVEYKEFQNKTLDDNVATSLFSIACPASSSSHGFFEVDIFAHLTGNVAVGLKATYTFYFNNTGSPAATPVVETAKSGFAATGNFSLSSSGSTSVSGSNILFNLTANSGGTLGEGTSVQVYAKARLVTPVSTGIIYMTAT